MHIPMSRLSKLRGRHIIGLSVLFAQIVSIGSASLIPERFFCWAPYDQHTRYRIDVSLNGEALSPRAVQSRYRYRAEAWEPRNISNLFSIIRQYESTYGAADDAVVTVTYSTNGKPEATWHWPID